VTKRLIVTADDFGYSAAVNEAVVKAHRDGILRYASLMVDRPGAEEAARLAKEHPGLGVGLHLELCASDPAIWGARYFFSPADRARIEPEIERQLAKFAALGLAPTHVDGHFNIHVHPVIFPRLCRLARRFAVPRIRLPGGEAGLCRSYGKGGSFMEGFVFSLLRAWLVSRSQGLAVPPRTFGLLRSGLMDEDYLIHLIERLPDGETEIYTHPTAEPGTEVVDRPTPTHHTVTELKALLSPRLREVLTRAGVDLTQPARAAS
jgi:chitin disaccharide deacetylase